MPPVQYRANAPEPSSLPGVTMADLIKRWLSWRLQPYDLESGDLPVMPGGMAGMTREGMLPLKALLQMYKSKQASAGTPPTNSARMSSEDVVERIQKTAARQIAGGSPLPPTPGTPEFLEVAAGSSIRGQTEELVHQGVPLSDIVRGLINQGHSVQESLNMWRDAYRSVLGEYPPNILQMVSATHARGFAQNQLPNSPRDFQHYTANSTFANSPYQRPILELLNEIGPRLAETPPEGREEFLTALMYLLHRYPR